jgi:hypothetical protein
MATELSGSQSFVALFSRAIDAMEGGLPPEAARAFLALKLIPADAKRLAFLSEKVQEEDLTQLEREELEQFHCFGHLLEVLDSKARRSLKAAASREEHLVHS